MASLLSGEGFHVLRFDYAGTGDSYGGPEVMSIARWKEDLGIAIEELMDMAAVDSVWLVGLRLGGSLAAELSNRPEVAGIVLWDPVLEGASQLAGAKPMKGAADVEVAGLPISPGFRAELTSLDLAEVPIKRGIPALLAVSSDTPAYQGFRDRISGGGADLSYRHVPSDGRWNEFDNWGSALIPQALIRAIVDYLKQKIR